MPVFSEFVSERLQRQPKGNDSKAELGAGLPVTMLSNTLESSPRDTMPPTLPHDLASVPAGPHSGPLVRNPRPAGWRDTAGTDKASPAQLPPRLGPDKLHEEHISQEGFAGAPGRAANVGSVSSYCVGSAACRWLHVNASLGCACRYQK
jgi:hypothetical protein